MYIYLVVLILSSQWDYIVEAQLRECNNRISFRSSLPKHCGTFGAAQYGSGGRNANREELPWQVGVYSKKTRPYMQICGGSLVSSNVVITAAHCFWSDLQKVLPAEDYAVAVTKLYRPWNDPEDKKYAKRSNIREIRVPPRFQGSTTNFQDDLALLLLAQPFQTGTTIIPVCLDFDYDLDAEQLTHGNIGKVAGWGRTGANGAASPTLQVLTMPAVDIQECIAKIDPAFLPAITSDKICAGYTDTGIAVCMGDSGGGLSFFDNNTFRYYLRGVVSTAPKSEDLCNIHTYATFTHIIKHENFILSVISEAAALVSDPVMPSKTSNKPNVLRLYPKSSQNPTSLDLSQDRYDEQGGQLYKPQPPIIPYDAEEKLNEPIVPYDAEEEELNEPIVPYDAEEAELNHQSYHTTQEGPLKYF